MVQGVEHILVGQDQLFPVFLDVPQGASRSWVACSSLRFINSTPELKYSLSSGMSSRCLNSTWVSGLMELAAAK